MREEDGGGGTDTTIQCKDKGGLGRHFKLYMYSAHMGCDMKGLSTADYKQWSLKAMH